MPDATIVHPFNFDIGPLSLTGFGIAVLLSFAIAQIIAQRELARRGHDPTPDARPDSRGGARHDVGGKLYYTLVVTHDIRDSSAAPASCSGAGSWDRSPLCYLTIKLQEAELHCASATSAGIGIAAGYAVGRTGCWAVGDDYGRPWNGPARGRVPRGRAALDRAEDAALFGVQPPPGASPDTLLVRLSDAAVRNRARLRHVRDSVALSRSQARRGMAVRRVSACWRGSSDSSSSSCAPRTTGSSARSRRPRPLAWHWRR